MSRETKIYLFLFMAGTLFVMNIIGLALGYTIDRMLLDLTLAQRILNLCLFSVVILLLVVCFIHFIDGMRKIFNKDDKENLKEKE